MDLRERSDGAVPDPTTGRRHPWERSRARFFGRLVVELATARPPADPIRRLLDVGAGDDWLGRSFVPLVRAHGDPAATVTCWDVHYGADDLAAPVPDGLTRTATRPEGSFDLITALDVIEHVADEDQFLDEQVVGRLAAGGHAIISAPAHPSLYGDHDRMLGHFRRYRPTLLRAVVERHLDIVEHGTLFTSLLVPRALQVGLERIGRHGDEPGVGDWSGGPALTRVIEAVLDVDATVSRRLHRANVRVPGLSVWVVARGRVR